MNDNGLNNPAVIIGNPDSLFPRSLASYWRSQGLEVAIVTRGHWKGAPVLPDGVRVLSSDEHESAELANQLNFISSILTNLEQEVWEKDKKRFAESMAGWGESGHRPSVVSSVIDGISISSLVRRLNPRFVFGQEAFSYGLATALCHGVPRLLMPWGGDIYLFAETSALAFALVKYALQQIDMVIPASVAATRHLCARFNLPVEKVQSVSWGVDAKAFSRADNNERKRVCAKFGIDPSATICLNVRRFRPAWGCENALQAFMRVAETEESCHFVMLGGAGTEEHVARARAQLSEKNLAKRFTLFDGNVLLSECTELMSVSDIFVSLMRVQDMRSLSILQAVSAGAVPVLSDQKEYREMERLGFSALFAEPDNIDAVVDALRTYVRNREFREEVVRKNRDYIDAYENYQIQMNKLLHIADDVSRNYVRRETTQDEKYFYKKICSASDLESQFSQVMTIDLNLPKEQIMNEKGLCYIYNFRTVAGKMFSYTRNYAGSTVFENGKALLQGDASHDDIRNLGSGRYSMWPGQIYFSPSDNSDPRANGNVYSIKVPAYIFVLENMAEDVISKYGL